MSCCMCMYVHMCMYFLQQKVLVALIHTNMHTHAHTYNNIKQKYAHICTTYARHMHRYIQIHTLSTRVRCKVDLYVSVCIWLYMYVSVLYVWEGAYHGHICMYMYLCACNCMCPVHTSRRAYQFSQIHMCKIDVSVCIMYVSCMYVFFLHVSGMYHVCVSMCTMYCMYWPKQKLLQT